MNEKIYGIDLGTTNSCISVLESGKPRVIDIEGDGIVPSAVSFDGETVIVGKRALNRAVAFPEQSVRSVKRLMGSPEKILAGGRVHTPEEISSIILKYLSDEACKLEGHEVKRVVITVPAYFSDAQRRATIEAGRMAGLEVERIINEPTAAALFYDRITVAGDDDETPATAQWRHTLVYDLGGGTFDVSVLRIGEIIEVLSSTGDTKLGGDDFDDALLDRIFDTIGENGGPDLRRYAPAVARLRSAAERAKIELSSKTSTVVEEANIPTPDENPCTVSLDITRNDFENMTDDLLDRTMNFVMKALGEANLHPADIDRVLLVGGMTRMPAIAERLTRVFGGARLPVVDPDKSVALGAAIQGGIISGDEAEQVLLDVTSHTLSTSAITWDTLECVPIIPRNTPIPTTRSRMFYSSFKNQPTALIEVYQGESDVPDENTFIGSVSLKLAKADMYCPIVVEYSYDMNGMIRIVVEQKGFSRKTEITLDSRNPVGEMPVNLDDEPDFDFADETFVAPVNFVTNRARKLLEKMPVGENREKLAALLDRYENALRDDSDDIDDVEDELLSLMEDI